MRKGNLIKMAAPAILSAAMMVSGLPVMAADFTSDTAVETEAQTDEFDAADDTADAFAGDEETPFVDDQAAAEDEFAATAETGYKYVYAGLTWAQYWASEGVYNAANTASNGTKDSHDELDKGGFDTVTRATVNHGLHRGSYQCEAIMYDKIMKPSNPSSRLWKTEAQLPEDLEKTICSPIVQLRMLPLKQTV